jgi:aminopeptidase-like protein
MINNSDDGRDMLELLHEFFPICRSITGDGVRETLRRLSEHVPLEICEVPSGTSVLDWTVPREWNITDAFIADSTGRRVVDFRENNLHVVNYSRPIDAEIGRTELLEHLHTLPDRPDWIPYRTAYYDEDWGFCIRHQDLKQFSADSYRVRIDSSLEEGALTFGELYLPGTEESDVLIYSHTCHPSLANDNLSGIVVTAYLAKALSGMKRRYGYRFVWGPGTIGSITWLARNADKLHRIKYGLVAVLLGDSGNFTYKKSRRGNASIDRISRYVVEARAGRTVEFDPFGYDERQFCSPGFDLPVGRLTRTPNGEYAEYHSSADNLSFVTAESLAESLQVCLEIVDVIEHDGYFLNRHPKGEPQLGRRGLYRKQGGEQIPERELAMLWLLNQCDGARSLLDIATLAGIPFTVIRKICAELVEAELLEPVKNSAVSR